MKRDTLSTVLILVAAVTLAPLEASAQFRTKSSSSRSSGFSKKSSSSRNTQKSGSSQRSSSNRSVQSKSSSSKYQQKQPTRSNSNTSSRNTSNSRNQSQYKSIPKTSSSKSSNTQKSNSRYTKSTPSRTSSSKLQKSSNSRTPSTTNNSRNTVLQNKLKSTSKGSNSQSRGTNSSRYTPNGPISNNIPKTKENWSTGSKILEKANSKKLSPIGKTGTRGTSKSPFNSKDIEAAKGKKMGIFPGERPSGKTVDLGSNGKKSPTLGGKTTGKTSIYDAINGKKTVGGNFSPLKKLPSSNAGNSNQNNESQNTSTASSNNSSNNNSSNPPQYLPKPGEGNSNNSGNNNNNNNPFGLLGDVVNDTVNQANDTANDLLDVASDVANGFSESPAAGAEAAVDGAVEVTTGGVNFAGNVAAGVAKGQVGLASKVADAVIPDGPAKDLKDQAAAGAKEGINAVEDFGTGVASGVVKGVGVITKAPVKAGEKAGQFAAEKGGQVINKGKKAGQWATDKAADAAGTIAEDPIGFGNNLKDKVQQGVNQTGRNTGKFIRDNAEKAFDAAVTATGNDPEATKDVILDRAGQAQDLINQGRDAADKLANDPEFRQEFANSLKDNVANQAKKRVDNVAEAGKNAIDTVSNAADVLLGNNRPSENNNDGKNPGNNGGPAQVVDDGTTAIDVAPPANNNGNNNAGNNTSNGGKGDVNGREPGNGQLTIEDILTGGKNPGKGNGREPGQNNNADDDNNNGGNQNDNNAEPPAGNNGDNNNGGVNEQPPMNNNDDNTQTPPENNGENNGGNQGGNNQDNDNNHNHDKGHGKQVIIDIITNLPVGGGIPQQGPIIIEQPVIIQQPVVDAPAPQQEVVEQPRIRTDLEVLDVRFIELGDASKNEGPRFRVFLKNHNNKFALPNVEIALIAGIDLGTEGTARKVEMGVIESIAAKGEANIDIRLPREVFTLAKDQAGNNVPFSQLAVIADPNEQFNDVKPENNVSVLGLDEVKHVDLKLEKLSSDKLQPTGKLVLTGEGFEFDAGAVALVINKKAYQMTVTEWSPTKIEATVPNFVLNQDMAAQLVVVRPDKTYTEPQLITLTK